MFVNIKLILNATLSIATMHIYTKQWLDTFLLFLKPPALSTHVGHFSTGEVQVIIRIKNV